jgi:DNA-binding Lrp family transcriptional regulator
MDDIDHRIIALLQEDARRSYRDIGADVGLSAPAVKRRVDRLQSAGVIRGFTAIVDPQPGIAATEAFIELFCKSGTSPARVLEAVQGYDQVVAAYTITGEADALVKVRTRDIRELEQVLEGISADPVTERTRSFVVLSELLQRPT